MADLSERQRDRARYYGGKEYATRKRQASTIETGLRAIVAAGSSRTVGATTSTLDSPELHGLFTEAELRTLAAAACIVGKAAAHLGACAKQAARIQDEYERRLDIARRVMLTLPHNSVDDIVALCGVAFRTPFQRYECDDARWAVSRGHSLTNWLAGKARMAIDELAGTCAREVVAPERRRNEIAARLPSLKVQHANLIAEFKAMAVQQRIEDAA